VINWWLKSLKDCTRLLPVASKVWGCGRLWPEKCNAPQFCPIMGCLSYPCCACMSYIDMFWLQHLLLWRTNVFAKSSVEQLPLSFEECKLRRKNLGLTCRSPLWQVQAHTMTMWSGPTIGLCERMCARVWSILCMHWLGLKYKPLCFFLPKLTDASLLGRAWSSYWHHGTSSAWPS